jgi:hypothetical protein
MLLLDLEPIFQAEQEYEQAVNRFEARVRKGLQTALDEGVREAINTRQYKDQTGLLTSRIRGWVEISTPGAASGWFGAFTNYASFVESGTRPHEIHGNPFLTFKARDGTWVTTRMVRHPGTKADGFVGRGYQKIERVLIREIEIAEAELRSYLEG